MGNSADVAVHHHHHQHQHLSFIGDTHLSPGDIVHRRIRSLSLSETKNVSSKTPRLQRTRSLTICGPKTRRRRRRSISMSQPRLFENYFSINAQRNVSSQKYEHWHHSLPDIEFYAVLIHYCKLQKESIDEIHRIWFKLFTNKHQISTKTLIKFERIHIIIANQQKVHKKRIVKLAKKYYKQCHQKCIMCSTKKENVVNVHNGEMSLLSGRIDDSLYKEKRARVFQNILKQKHKHFDERLARISRQTQRHDFKHYVQYNKQRSSKMYVSELHHHRSNDCNYTLPEEDHKSGQRAFIYDLPYVHHGSVPVSDHYEKYMPSNITQSERAFIYDMEYQQNHQPNLKQFELSYAPINPYLS